MTARTLKFGLMLGIFVMISSFSSVSASIVYPTGFSQEVDLTTTWIYDISEGNGDLLVQDPADYYYKYCAIETKGQIEFNFVGFYDNVPYFNVSFITASGTLNRTIVNMSSIAIARDFTLGLGYTYFCPGIYVNVSNWDNYDAIANQVANGTLYSPGFSWDGIDYPAYYYNGSLSIESKSGSHSYTYKQSPVTGGNQNTTMAFSETTGIIESFDTEFGDYKLVVAIHKDIPGFEVPLLLGSAIIGIIAVVRKVKK